MARVEHASRGFERYKEDQKDHGHEDSGKDRSADEGKDRRDR